MFIEREEGARSEGTRAMGSSSTTRRRRKRVGKIDGGKFTVSTATPPIRNIICFNDCSILSEKKIDLLRWDVGCLYILGQFSAVASTLVGY